MGHEAPLAPSRPGSESIDKPQPQSWQLTPAAALMLVATAWLTFKKWADFDLFWHLADGRLIDDQGIFPSPDRFSWSATGKHVALNSVRFDSVVYFAWEHGHAFILSMLAALLLITTLLPVALFLGRLHLRISVEGCALFLLVFALLPYAGLRPHLVGATCMGTLALLMERPFGWRKSIAVGGVLGFWLNFHGSFIFGFVLVGAGVLVWTANGDARAASFAALSAVIAAASTFLSPYGVELWLMPFRLSSNRLLQTYNRDWASLNPLSISDLPMAVLICAAVAVGVWRRSDPRSLAAAILVFPSIQYSRLTPLVAPILIMVLAERLSERNPRLMRNQRQVNAPAAQRRAAWLAWTTLAVGFAAMSIAGVRTLDAAAVSPLPTNAVNQLLSCGMPAPVWNDYNWGGYLIWRGGGAFLVGMDGRAETVYDAQTFARYVTVFDGSQGWEEIVQQSPAQYALTTAAARAQIDQLPGWRRVYADSVAVVAARDSAVWNCSGQ